MNITKISDFSWFATKVGEYETYLITKNNTHFTIVGNNSIRRLKTMVEVEKQLGAKLTISDVNNNLSAHHTIYETTFSIRGYLVDCDSPIYCAPTSNGLPLYRKNGRSHVDYAAGYYAVFRSRWVYILCPKLSTLQNNPYFGPYFSHADAVNAVKGNRGG